MDCQTVRIHIGNRVGNEHSLIDSLNRQRKRRSVSKLVLQRCRKIRIDLGIPPRDCSNTIGVRWLIDSGSISTCFGVGGRRRIRCRGGNCSA